MISGFIFVLLLLFLNGNALARPRAGDVYCEYSQHVGSRDWRVTDPNVQNVRAKRNLPNPVLTVHIGDLGEATRAEVLIDRWGGHTKTYDHKIRFNKNRWIGIPGLQTTPTGHEPQMYYYQDNPIVEIPLNHLKEGANTYEATCRGTSWGQWGMYSVILRIYYDPIKKLHPSGRILKPRTGDILGEYPKIEVEAFSDKGIVRVNVLGFYNGIDVDGDGVYHEYHRNYHQPERGQPAVINHHIGTSTTFPYRFVWDTRWVPDQAQGSIKIIARIQDNKGYWFVTEPVENLSLARKASSVRLYRPYEVPEKFGVRKNREQAFCKLYIPENHDLDHIAEASIHFRTWNGTDRFHQGLRINTWHYDIGGKTHHYAYSCFPIPKDVLKRRENIISFHSETEHHACEVLWPGPMVVVRYGDPIDPNSTR